MARKKRRVLKAADCLQQLYGVTGTEERWSSPSIWLKPPRPVIKSSETSRTIRTKADDA